MWTCVNICLHLNILSSWLNTDTHVTQYKALKRDFYFLVISLLFCLPTEYNEDDSIADCSFVYKNTNVCANVYKHIYLSHRIIDCCCLSQNNLLFVIHFFNSDCVTQDLHYFNDYWLGWSGTRVGYDFECNEMSSITVVWFACCKNNKYQSGTICRFKLLLDWKDWNTEWMSVSSTELTGIYLLSLRQFKRKEYELETLCAKVNPVMNVGPAAPFNGSVRPPSTAVNPVMNIGPAALSNGDSFITGSATLDGAYHWPAPVHTADPVITIESVIPPGTDLQLMTVAQLRSLCTQLKIATSGNKSKLIGRLQLLLNC